MRINAFRTGGAAPFLLLALVLGGASGNEAGALANALLQFTAVIFILIVLWSRPNVDYPRQAKVLSWIVAAYLAFVIVSVIPLPASVWQALPGREPFERGYQLLGLDNVSVPISLTPQRTIASILWLLPPVAMFLLVLTRSHDQRKKLPWVIMGFSILSIALGAAQLLGGPSSRLRPYSITNPDLPVGLFANGNHLATLLVCTLPFAGYLASRSAGKRKHRSNRSSGLMLAVAVSIFLVVGIAAIGSLAGYGLAIPIGVASLLIYRRAVHGKVSRSSAIALAGIFVVFLALALSGPLDQKQLTSKFSDDPYSRKQMALTTIEGARSVFPVGSGLGSFQDMYRVLDDPDLISGEYVNHAHNDYVEVALELGLPGILVIIAFLAWWGTITVKVWRSDEEGSNLARAGSVVIAVVIMHSVVEYPLRTSAIACLVALSCALMVRPWLRVKRTGESPTGDAGGLRHLQVD